MPMRTLLLDVAQHLAERYAILRMKISACA
jgi:hypothetical protein